MEIGHVDGVNKGKVLVYDLRGFGISSKPTYGYSLKHQSKYLRNLLQSLEISNYWLIGHSLGGMITLKYSEKFFDEIKGVVLIDTTAYIPTKFSISSKTLAGCRLTSLPLT